ncbi:hypothetical protein L3X38_028055 [Prunus dulcis]|uniref:Uncharacterized protein n=1 Tax=Prunus dulcis TaxID=3755 RepID=A0AAD4Z1Q3_PRUDU|nr:hypothetical protein L3X38_028055 [Prunus dulcis]
MNQIVPYVPPQPSDPLMEKISRLEQAINKLTRDKYDVVDLDNLSLYPKWQSRFTRPLLLQAFSPKLDSLLLSGSLPQGLKLQYLAYSKHGYLCYAELIEFRWHPLCGLCL